MTDNNKPERFSKWTHSSMLKLHEREWSRFLKHTLDDKRTSKVTKNRRIDRMLEWFKLIERLCINGELSVKK